MDIQAFFCLDAQQRGELVDVLGAGVPVYFFDELPHDARFPIVLIVSFTAEEMGREHQVQMRMTAPSGAPFADGTLTIDTSKMTRVVPGGIHMLSALGSLAGRVPDRGVYRLDVSNGGQVVRTVRVAMDLAPPTSKP